MEAIQMVNLKAQYHRFKSEFDGAFERVCQEAAFIKGPELVAFERELAAFLGVKHVIGVANGTDALQIALMSLDLEQGDEIIIPAFAYAALPEVILLLGLKPVFVDVSLTDFLIDVSKIESKITSKTRVLAPVHLFGLTANMDILVEIAKRHKLFILEDAAQSLGSQYCSETCFGSSGALGDIGTTSFFPSKNLGCFGDGGAVFTNDDVRAEKIRMLANHGQSKRYYHEIVGVNSRLDSLQAAVLRVKLPHLEWFISRRREIAALYNREFTDLEGIVRPKEAAGYSTHSYHQYTLRILDNKRDALAAFLLKNSIPSIIYYPLPLHRQMAYLSHDVVPVSEQLCQEVLSLPICPELTDEQQYYIINNLKSFYKS